MDWLYCRISSAHTDLDGSYTCTADHDFGSAVNMTWSVITSNMPRPSVHLTPSSNAPYYYGQKSFYIVCTSGERISQLLVDWFHRIFRILKCKNWNNKIKWCFQGILVPYLRRVCDAIIDCNWEIFLLFTFVLASRLFGALCTEMGAICPNIDIEWKNNYFQINLTWKHEIRINLLHYSQETFRHYILVLIFLKYYFLF